MKDKMDDISSSVVSLQTVSAHPAESSEQVEDADVIVPVSQPDSESDDVTENPPIDGEFTDKMLKDIDVHDFCFILETMYNYTADHREEAKRKEREESRRKQEESGIDVITPEKALVKCTSFMNDILTGYNLYKKHESAIDKQQTKSKEIADTQNETVKRLETVIGRIRTCKESRLLSDLHSLRGHVWLTCSGTGLCMVLLFSGSRSTSADSASSPHSL